MVDVDRFILDLTNGKVPDLVYGNISDTIDTIGIYNSNRVFNALVRGGLVEDLYTFLDNDPNLGREDFLPKALEAMEYQNKLVVASKSFGISTYMAKPDYVSNSDMFTIADMYDALKKMPDGASVFSGMKRTEILYEALHYNVFFDPVTGLVDFENDAFIEVLDFVKNIPSSKENFDERSYTFRNYFTTPLPEDESISLFDDIMLINTTVFLTYRYFFESEVLYGFTPVYIGFPNSNGVGARFNIRRGILMTTACKEKEAAWEFIKKLFLDYRNPKEEDEWLAAEFSTNINTFNARLEFNNEAPASHHSDGIGIGIYRSKLSQYEIDLLMNLIDNATVYKLDSRIWPIISEQAELYFAGEKTAKEVAQNIQNRVQIFYDEQYG